MRLSNIHNLHDFEPLARSRLPRPIFSYISNGAEDEVSLRGNRESFERHALIPRMLVDVSRRTQEISLFGETYSSPFGISPVGLGALYAYDGDVALATAAHAKRVPYVLSGASLTRLETVAQAAPGSWFQAYLPGDRSEIERLLRRVADAGYRQLVVTVDIPVSVNPDRYLRNGFSSPLKPSLALAWQGISHPHWLTRTFLQSLLRKGMPHLENWRAERGHPILASSVQKDFRSRDSFTWDHIRAIRDHWRGNLIIKGVMCAQDAVRCRESGADGVIVSNHGGRQADGVAPPLSVLEEVVAAVPELVVMMDGGMRRGSDVLKALALGARCVFAGRPFNFALAARGRAGVETAIEILAEEIHRNMAHLGICHPYEMSRAFLRKL